MNYVGEIEALFDTYEDNHLTEAEIFGRCIDLVLKQNKDRDYMFDINDTLFNRGYSFQFDVPPLDRKEFNQDDYVALSSQSTKSKDKTKDLIDYLRSIHDFRLTFASMHMLKVDYLISLGYLPSDNEYINNRKGFTLRELLYRSYEENLEAKAIIVKALEKLGVLYSGYEEMEFKLDLEYLLWTIERDEKGKESYKKVNTLKVAFNLAPKEYFIRDGKLYYNPRLSKVTKDYLKCINQKCINVIKDWWGEEGYSLDGTGYAVFYQLLTKK